ncbi:putative protein [Arabidopsis thaliana]|nr:Ggamma-subunit 1 [Arabidopsis thaliana]ANM63533.1 Ggamma-subunit 1 [Arabidopsis thaliana]CAB87795.1 putative protein [Arabidopsis thaliana]|eukprot:NP_001325615.1 Ggamma-subunit 1 [Arabidopsis thaliana]
MEGKSRFESERERLRRQFKLVRTKTRLSLTLSDLRPASERMREETVVYEQEESVSHGGGKHRILAELARVEQEVAFLEKELKEVENTDIVSTVCEELLSVIEKGPDPLLPLTNGPLNLGWDRWFEGPNGGEGCRCLIL